MTKLLGTKPNQAPTNADLGDLAYQDMDKLPTINVADDGLVVTEAGNVGIGTSSPSATLHVASGSGANDDFDLRISEFRPNIVLEDLSDSNGTDWQIFVDSDDLQFRYGDADTNTKLANEAMCIAGSGNVGIGTSSPEENLHVESSGFATIQIESTGASSDPELNFTNDTGGASEWSLRLDKSASDVFQLRYNNSAVMTVDTSGNVGIGTSSPAENLHIDGGAAAGYLKVTNNASTQGIEVGVSAAGDGIINVQDAAALRLFTSDAERMRIDSSGNVGIGISPSFALDVYRSSTNTSIVVARNDTSTTAMYATSSSSFAGTTTNTPFGFITNNAERMRIDSSGNVGIGTTSISGGVQLDVRGTGVLQLVNTDTVQLVASSGGSTLKNVSNNPLLFGTNNTERMRIDALGNLLVGTTALIYNTSGAGSGFEVNSVGYISTKRNSTSLAGHVVFHNPNGIVGMILTSGTTTSYSTSSDYRLKEDVQPMHGASDRLMALKPVNFAWKVDGSRVDGFLAHEAQEVVPEAVTGTKDAVDADGKPEYQGIDQSKLLPVVVAALQEALIKIKTLEARVAALET